MPLRDLTLCSIPISPNLPLVAKLPIVGKEHPTPLSCTVNSMDWGRNCKVISIFGSLLKTDEQIVGKPIGSLFLGGRPEDLDKIGPIIEAVIKRPTIRGAALYYILEYLEKCLLVDPSSCFQILETLLNNVGDDFYNFRDFIPATRSKAPLNILNTIFECYFDLEDRALKVLDKLIELRWAGVDEYLKAAERL